MGLNVVSAFSFGGSVSVRFLFGCASLPLSLTSLTWHCLAQVGSSTRQPGWGRSKVHYLRWRHAADGRQWTEVCQCYVGPQHLGLGARLDHGIGPFTRTAEGVEVAVDLH